MNRYKTLIVEVKRFPESQEVMDKEGWFPIGDYGKEMHIGDSAYARILNEDEYILVEKTTADEYNKEYQKIVEKTNTITARDPGDEHHAS